MNRFATGLLLLVMALPAATHHSFAAQYDSKKPVNLGGVVTRVEWTNPHVYIFVDVTDAKTKKVVNWGFEMGPPHMLQKAGWKRNSLKIGEQVEVEGWLARDGSNHANARRVTRSSTGEALGAASSAGQTLTGSGAATRPPAPAGATAR
ncbi:MAG TPA: DUF6152 family protein [Steroidobacteraceae bacterium]|nr:DUF6152 family protein [Steroidobacteraceae bacterium]